MAISRHSTEWLKTIFVAKAVGVTFERKMLTRSPYKRYPQTYWWAKIGKYMECRDTKYGAAKAILEVLDHAKGLDALLPDAADPATDPAAPGIELRSSR